MAVRLQEQLRGFEWLELVPEHFLHVWLGVPERLGVAPERWPGRDEFEIEYSGPNCFHSAVVLEVTEPVRRLVEGTENDVPEFLPHMTVAVTRTEHEPDELRDILRSIRGSFREKQAVERVKRVSFPIAQSLLFSPWAVLETVRLGERAS